MGILDVINGMNDGKGMRALTEEGEAELWRRSKARMRELGVNVYPRFRQTEEFRKLENELFAPENEGRYWTYATAIARPVMRGRR